MVRQQKTILIVDDEADIRHMLRLMLEPDYRVIEADDGDVAVRMALRSKPDLILMDIIMPKMNGWAACKTIKSNSEIDAIPVIILTALDFIMKDELRHQMGADGYITKPFHEWHLLETIERFLSDSE